MEFRAGPAANTHDPESQPLNSAVMVRQTARGVLGLTAAICLLSSWLAASAHADALGYLVNVTVRPGYNFANADQAVTYGNGICDKITGGQPFSQLVADIKGDFNTDDEFQATYLISQAAQELCPAAIWQLRQSAAHYVPVNP